LCSAARRRVWFATVSTREAPAAAANAANVPLPGTAESDASARSQSSISSPEITRSVAMGSPCLLAPPGATFFRASMR